MQLVRVSVKKKSLMRIIPSVLALIYLVLFIFHHTYTLTRRPHRTIGRKFAPVVLCHWSFGWSVWWKCEMLTWITLTMLCCSTLIHPATSLDDPVSPPFMPRPLSQCFQFFFISTMSKREGAERGESGWRFNTILGDSEIQTHIPLCQYVRHRTCTLSSNL